MAALSSKSALAAFTILLALAFLLIQGGPVSRVPTASLSQAMREQLIRSYYRAHQPDWRKQPPRLTESNGQEALLNLPIWYGNVSVGGNSPFDYKAKSDWGMDRKYRILFLLSFRDYLERMNSHSYEIVDAALANPALEVDVWGHGWDSWNANLSLSKNLEQRILPGTDSPIGCGYYDIYWSISDYPSQKEPWVDHAGCNSVHIHQLGDCHNDECINNVFTSQGNVTSSKYAFELLDMLSYGRLRAVHPNMHMQLFTHSADAANPWDYFPLRNWTEKQQEAVLFGASYGLYTIRPTVLAAIDAKQTFIRRFQHPGFEIWRSHVPKKKLPSYRAGHASYRVQIQKRREFATGLRNTKICIFDSSMERKAIRKYAQAFLSGCVVAGDLPTEQEPNLRDFMIVLRPQASFEEINTIIYRALEDPLELQRKALAAFAYAREYLTNTRKVDNVIRDVIAYKAGKRGYHVPKILEVYGSMVLRPASILACLFLRRLVAWVRAVRH